MKKSINKIEGPPGTGVFTAKPNNLAQYLVGVKKVGKRGYDKRITKMQYIYTNAQVVLIIQYTNACNILV